jgi:hypothetical protein
VPSRPGLGSFDVVRPNVPKERCDGPTSTAPAAATDYPRPRTGGAHLAQLYGCFAARGTSSGDSAANAWAKFSSAIGTLPDGVTSDDPFDALATAGAQA